MKACCIGMQAVAVWRALDRGDARPCADDGKRQARQDAPAVEQHRAGAALAVVAAFLGAGKAETLAERVEQRRTPV